ncbi:MAG: glycosyltransferase family 2 protein [bacterium]|nr:glycosyltransferase family 2 protein [bacterium]
MKQLIKNKATLCIVNYKTEELTRLCLRSIRKYTKYPYEVIVVDNNSDDASLEYLRTVPWIKLIERPGVELSGSMAQGTALDLGLKECNTEFFLGMHTDTFVHRYDWLSWLINEIKRKKNTACAGSGKLDLKPKWQVLLKKYTDYKKWIRELKSDNPDKKKFYIRAICAIYSTEILLKENLSFSMEVKNGMTCAQEMYVQMLKRGYNTNSISDFKMSEYVYHLAHATMVLNPEFRVRDKTQKNCKKKMEKILNTKEIQQVMEDNSLDR